MTPYLLRSETEALLAEFAANAEPEARPGLAERGAELAEVLRERGYEVFLSTWYDAVQAAMDELTQEFRER